MKNISEPDFTAWIGIPREKFAIPEITLIGKFILYSQRTIRTVRMSSSGMCHREDLVRTDVSEERMAASTFRVKLINELRTRWQYLTTVVRCEELNIIWKRKQSNYFRAEEGDTFSETSVITSATRWHIQEDNILHNHRREDLNLTWSGLRLAESGSQSRFSNEWFLFLKIWWQGIVETHTMELN
jgi:hypothetical protein